MTRVTKASSSEPESGSRRGNALECSVAFPFDRIGKRTRHWVCVAVATIGGLGLVFVSEHFSLDGTGSAFSTAEARIGRPLTPMSYAGVARRTTRRAVAVGAAAGAGAYYYRAPGCVQVVNAYGQIVYQCP